MKIRIIPLGKGKLDPRSFGFQYMAHLKIAYLRLWLFGVYATFSSFDIAADYERIVAEKRPIPPRPMNRKGRRTIAALMRRQRHA